MQKNNWWIETIDAKEIRNSEYSKLICEVKGCKEHAYMSIVYIIHLNNDTINYHPKITNFCPEHFKIAEKINE